MKVNNETFTATEDHPFYVEGKGWVEAISLHAGMTIWFANGTKGTVEDISNEGLEDPVTVYNFEVKDFHTYFVGDSGVLVHNTCTNEIVPDKGFDSFAELKEEMGNPGEGNQWHHIVEQSQIGKRANFTSQQVNNVNNIIAVPSGSGSVHSQISAHYSSKFDYTDDKTVRDWLATQSFEQQFEYGKNFLSKFGSVTATDKGWVFTPNSD